MRILLSAVVAATLAGFATFSSAGVKGVLETKVEPLSDVVSYSKAATVYKVGYKVTITHVGGNNVNGVVFRGTTQVARRDAAPSPINGAAAFIEADDASTCQPVAFAAPGSAGVSCAFGRIRAGDAPKVFAVYFASPVNVQGFDGSASPTIEMVRFAGATGYSEDTNDSSGVGNDTANFEAIPVSLGTPDPTRVQGAVSKIAGGAFSTGPDDAVPKLGTYQFAAKVIVPPAPVVTNGTVQLKRFNATDNPVETQLCDANRNFLRCYEASLTIPGLAFPVAANPADQKFVTTLLRIDSTELKSSFNVRKVKVIYTDDNGVSDPNGLPRCVDLPLSDTTSHCVVDIRQYGRSLTNGLASDVEVEVRGLTNGRTTIY
jgi:hypothetical protein